MPDVGKWITWFTGQGTQEECEISLRKQFLVVSSCSLVVVQVFFIYLVSSFPADSTVVKAVLGLGTLLCLLNPFLLKWTRNIRITGILFSLEIVLTIGVLAALSGGGFGAASLLWLPAAPLMAALLVSHRFGWFVAGLAVLEVCGFYLVERYGVALPSRFTPPQESLIQMAVLVLLILSIAALVWLYESRMVNTLRLVNRELTKANDALRQAHAVLETRVEERTAELARTNSELSAHIAERDRMEAMVHRNEEHFRALVQNSSDIISIMEADGTSTYHSPSMERVLGYTSAELAGVSVFNFIHPEDVGHCREMFAQLLGGALELPLLQCRFQHAEGYWVPLEVSGHNLLHDPSISGIVVTSRDITERKMYEDSLREAKEKAEELARLKSSFLANMSHEIRTPLTGIIGFAEVLEEELADEHRTFAETIGASGKRLLDTLNSILDLSRIDAELMEAVPRHIDIVAEVKETVGLLQPLAHKKDLLLTVDTCLCEKPVVHDPAWLGRIINNLVGNAVKFTRDGSITVALDCTLDMIRISVQDTGIGISEEFIPHLFDEFKQESSGCARSHEGTGLGLAITHKLVQGMGGNIRVESSKGNGSTFIVTLPLEHGGHPQTLPEKKTGNNAYPAAGAPALV